MLRKIINQTMMEQSEMELEWCTLNACMCTIGQEIEENVVIRFQNKGTMS